MHSNRLRQTIVPNAPSFNPDQAVTNSIHLFHSMWYDHDRRPLLLYFAQTLETLFLKPGIPNSKNLINQQNVSIDIDCYCKCKPHIHSRRICSNRIVNKLLQLCKTDNLRQPPVNLPSFQAKNCRIDIDIFPPAHVRVKPRSQLNQAWYPAPHRNPAGVWF